MPFSRPWTPCLLLLLALTLASGGVSAEEISKPDADAILERFLQGAAIDSAAALRELEAATDFYRQAGEVSRHAQSLVLLGMAYDAGRRHPEALKAYREAGQALAALGDSLGVAFLEVHMGIPPPGLATHEAYVRPEIAVRVLRQVVYSLPRMVPR